MNRRAKQVTSQSSVWLRVVALALIGMYGSGRSQAAESKGFGSRNSFESSSEGAPTKNQELTKPAAIKTSPPNVENVEWLRVPFEKAENEVLALFQRDLPRVEEFTHDVVLYEVRTSGALPQSYGTSFRGKLEKVIVSARSLRLKSCPNCDQARIVRDESGELRYESNDSDPKRPMRIASEVGVSYLLFAELVYSHEDLELHVRLVDAAKNEVKWIKDYSTADVVKTRAGNRFSSYEEVGPGDSLSRVLIGEIAFTTVVASGMMMVPTINTGAGADSLFCPAIDLFIGEKYDSGRKRFGFILGAVVNMAKGAQRGKPLPFGVRVGPHFRYTINPFNVTSARWSIGGELGGFISMGMVTGYVGIGPEVTMMQRFSVSLVPIYFLPTTVSGGTVSTQREDGKFDTISAPDQGKFGGLGILSKLNINW